MTSSGGSFPASIAVHGDLMYVMNSGDAGALQGYRLAGDRSHPIQGSSRSLGLANATPPNFLTSPGQVGFSPDGSRLIVTTKVSGSMIDVWAVRHDGRLSSTPAMNASTSPVPFAFTFDRHGRLITVEAALGQLSTYGLHPDNTLAGIGTTTPSGQTGHCAGSHPPAASIAGRTPVPTTSAASVWVATVRPRSLCPGPSGAWFSRHVRDRM